jgi:hypothetical protein
MFQLVQILALLFVALAMAFAVAHAAELPGKMRLDRDTYLATQTVYSPGFTIGGMSEPASIIVLAVLAVITPTRFPGLWWTLAALACMLAMQAVYWLATHPVNRFWLRNQELGRTSRAFFDLGGDAAAASDWRVMRNGWEYSHVARAVLAVIGFLCLSVAATLRLPALAGLNYGA